MRMKEGRLKEIGKKSKYQDKDKRMIVWDN